LRHFIPHIGWFWRITRIGFFAGIQNLMWSTGFAVFVKLLARLPDATAAQAALTVAISIEALAYMPGVAYGIAAGPLVGQNLGAKKPERAGHCAWIATGHAVAIMTAVGIFFLSAPGFLAGLFTREGAEFALIVSYLRWNAIAEPFLAAGIVLAGALQGAGDVLFPTVIEFVINWPARLTLAWLLAIKLGYGAQGAWMAMAATTIIYGIAVSGWFRVGKWRTARV
jgi:Na+-driven multidrug efflux pump